jgi:ATP-dependent Lon protease
MFNREKDKENMDTKQLPMMPIRDVVIFPHMMTPFIVGRETSVRALEEALATEKKIFLATQHDASIDDPQPNQIHQVGTVANIVQSVKLPDGNIRVLVEGVERARVLNVETQEGFFRATLRILSAPTAPTPQLEEAVKRVTQLFDQFVKMSQNLNYETMINAVRGEDPAKLADTVAANLPLAIEEKQELLELFDTLDRLTRLGDMLEFEIEKLSMDRNIQSRVKRQMEKAQKEFYLNEKMKAIQKELGRGEKSEFDELKKKIESAGMPKDVQEKALQELKKMEMMPPMSAESTVSRNYIDWLLAVPWKQRSREIRDMAKAEKILETDHYGLEKIKERILEFLAVRRLVKTPRGSILCFVGPPGTGKTSLGRSIARATGRKFVRLSLGGVRDEAEIRGHRRTYIGALPGQIIQMMRKAGTINPIFMLDEVDKMSMDFRGDPSAALMEVLDPELNHSFTDHYLDAEYNLREVMFICTANVLHTIPQPLLDRMEVIRLSGYTDKEKLEIAKRFLVIKQRKQNGLGEDNLNFADESIQHIIAGYTREAGVRNLEREIANVCRKMARRVVKEGKEAKADVDPEKVKDFLGVIKYRDTQSEKKNEVGLAQGLAWTEVGGQLLGSEATLMEGKGKLTLTGNFYRHIDVHVHVPEGAIPKDGPSAGITLATAMVSALTKIPVRCDIAMTGEITLRGKVLPIGGVKEKLLAAHRNGIPTVILPKDNEKDLEEIPEYAQEALTVKFVETMDEVLRLALEKELESLPVQVEGDKPAVRPGYEIGSEGDQDRVTN